MKNIFVIFLLTTMVCYSQKIKTISWETKTTKISNKEYDLVIMATLEPNYHLYSQTVPDNGPLPTIFSFNESKNYKLVGVVKEPIEEATFDPVFENKIKSFDNKAIFSQRIKVTSKKRFKIIGKITFMTCNDKTCIRGNKTIEFKINKL
ncbi:cytochrome C biogenesis protein [Winogradskyella undariae]|uniref:protein-disulfide reductase DsbD domain-containing protein n=1 Tax=Winogradskyella undariae TaxID=1285465 RepID=UPI00156B4DC7|nr:protein-disulfide reductase DsbD domain-containing protein [Winogradskyella undariae]NRR93493.1 cytochrome C biogenesis protein [Winogradskyella undariae]